MVDIREVGERAAESMSIRNIVARFMEMEIAQAATVRIMPWLFVNPRNLRSLRHFRFPWDERGLFLIPALFWERYFGIDDFVWPMNISLGLSMSEINDRFERYSKFSRFFGDYRYPFHLMLHVNKYALEPRDLETLQGLIGRTGVFTTFERRGPMKLQFSAGDRISSGGRIGTIGGFINDGSGGIFGVTCSHVIAALRVDDLSGTQVGTMGPSARPTAMSGATVCTPFPPAGATAAVINARDFALVKLSKPSAPTGLRVATALHQGDAVDVNANGMRYRFHVRSLCIAMRLAIGGINHCFAPLVELYSSAGTTWPGDSGSWGLINQHSEWGAMVAGADDISTFAFDARDVVPWIDGCGVVSPRGWSIH